MQRLLSFPKINSVPKARLSMLIFRLCVHIFTQVCAMMLMPAAGTSHPGGEGNFWSPPAGTCDCGLLFPLESVSSSSLDAREGWAPPHSPISPGCCVLYSPPQGQQSQGGGGFSSTWQAADIHCVLASRSFHPILAQAVHKS